MGAAEVEQPSDDPEKHTHELRDLDSEARKETFSICAPQLLHLDVAGRPLWFNGWLLPNKFSDDPTLRPVNFESFIVEPSVIKDPGPWELKLNNVLCISSEHIFNFTTAEKRTLDTTIEIAKRVGAIGA
jgi:hypothetical protein